MDLKDTIAYLKEYDVKNIDPAHIKNTLIRRKDIMANIAIVLVTTIVAVNIIGSRKARIKQLTQEISKLEKKVEAISALEDAQKNLNSFADTLATGIIEANDIIEKLNELAVARGINVSSFKPQRQNATDFYEQTNIQLNIPESYYSDIGFFIYDIENAPYNFRVESWSASRRSVKKRRRGGNAGSAVTPDSKKINVTLDVTSIKIKK